MLLIFIVIALILFLLFNILFRFYWRNRYENDNVPIITVALVMLFIISFITTCIVLAINNTNQPDTTDSSVIE